MIAVDQMVAALVGCSMKKKTERMIQTVDFVDHLMTMSAVNRLVALKMVFEGNC